jgi:hypothetical protein
MGMFEDLQKQYIEARKAQNKLASTVLNMAISELKYEKINKQKELDDGDVLAYLQKSIKGKREVIEEFRIGGRNDLVEKETAELEYLLKLQPPMLTEDEVRAIVLQAKTETGAGAPSDMGKLMKEVMARVKGKADGAMVKNLVTEALKNA